MAFCKADRMPVVLDPNSYDLWLYPGMRDVGGVNVEALRCSADAPRFSYLAFLAT